MTTACAKFEREVSDWFGSLVQQYGFVSAGCLSGGVDGRSGEEIVSVFFESPTQRIQFYQADGEANILIGSKAAGLKPGAGSDWKYLRSLVVSKSLSLNELLSLVPDVPQANNEQFKKLLPVLVQHLKTSTGHADP